MRTLTLDFVPVTALSQEGKKWSGMDYGTFHDD